MKKSIKFLNCIFSRKNSIISLNIIDNRFNSININDAINYGTRGILSFSGSPGLPILINSSYIIEHIFYVVKTLNNDYLIYTHHNIIDRKTKQVKTYLFNEVDFIHYSIKNDESDFEEITHQLYIEYLKIKDFIKKI